LVDRNLIKGIFNRRPHKRYDEDVPLIKGLYDEENSMV